jgi:ATP-binding cassette subfamily C (CFTR/MRP) protein 1
VHPLIIDSGNFSWDLEHIEKPILRNINLQIKQGQLVALVGSVGSGKSSLVSAFLGEMDKLSGRVNTRVTFTIKLF